MYCIHPTYVCGLVILHIGLCEYMWNDLFACVCELCVLKSENNKQRSQTVILHKRTASFFSFTPGDKVLFRRSSSNKPGPQPLKPAPGEWYVCVSVCC